MMQPGIWKTRGKTIPVETELERQMETNLALSITVVRRIELIALRNNLTEGRVALVAVGIFKLRSIECVEVVHLQNALESLAHVEVFPHVEVFSGIAVIS
jgi:hypothetical protein